MQTRLPLMNWKSILALTFSIFTIAALADKADYIASFAQFDKRARSSTPVNVVFFGGSMTWGEGASDPEQTSYRALTEDYLRHKYPLAKFHFYDAAIGGTGSQLGMFRLDSDVLAHQPDLVFLDFTPEDRLDGTDRQTLGSYERILRELTAQGVPIVQILIGARTNFGVDWNHLGPERVRAHSEMGVLYHTAIADTFPIVQNFFQNGRHTRDEIWPHDDMKANDVGHELFFQAIRDALEKAIRKNRIGNFPLDSVFADQYAMRLQLFPSKSPLPSGWRIEPSLRTTALQAVDLANGWLNEVAVSGVENRDHVKPIELDFNGTFLGILGEADEHGLGFKIWIDGAPALFRGKDSVWPTSTAKLGGGQRFFWHKISDKLALGRHSIQIEPAISDDDKQGELRIESICVAGPGTATPTRLSVRGLETK